MPTTRAVLETLPPSGLRSVPPPGRRATSSADPGGAALSRPVLVVVGSSASGKSSLVRALARRGALRVHPTWTTRPRRHDERHGSLEHRFVSDAAFDEMAEDGFFLDTVALFDLPYRYGLPPLRLASDGPVDTVMLRAPLVARFGQFVPHHLVYQIEVSPERALARLRVRGSSPRELAARLDDNRREVAAGRLVAHRVFVNDGPLGALAGSVADALRRDLAAVRSGRGEATR